MMERRDFLRAMLASWASAAGGIAFPMGEDPQNREHAVTQLPTGSLLRLGGLSLDELRDFHEARLREYIALWENDGVDRAHGGFFDRPALFGKTSNKRAYYQGRALWVFAYLYNNITSEKRHLEAAIQGRDFLVRHMLGENCEWISEITADGKPVSGSEDIYGDIYMVLGLTELYRATQDPADLKLAQDTCISISDRITSSSFLYRDDYPQEPGSRRLGTWQHFLGSLTPLLRIAPDPVIDRIAIMCVRNMLDRHWRPEFGVYLEMLDDRYEPLPLDPNGPYNRLISAWHSVQAAWMIMDEALRRNDRAMFRQALETGISTFEHCWSDVAGLVILDNPEQKPSDDPSDFSIGCLDDAMLFCLLGIEHLHQPLLIERYGRMFRMYADRPEQWRTGDLLHYPRRLFYVRQILDRIIRRNGNVSDFLETAGSVHA